MEMIWRHSGYAVLAVAALFLHREWSGMQREAAIAARLDVERAENERLAAAVDAYLDKTVPMVTSMVFTEWEYVDGAWQALVCGVKDSRGRVCEFKGVFFPSPTHNDDAEVEFPDNRTEKSTKGDGEQCFGTWRIPDPLLSKGDRLDLTALHLCDGIAEETFYVRSAIPVVIGQESPWRGVVTAGQGD